MLDRLRISPLSTCKVHFRLNPYKMGTSDLSMLIDMGFDEERAKIAVKKTGSRTSSTDSATDTDRCSVQDAIDWLGNNQDRPLDEIQAEIAEEEEAAGPKVTAAAVETGEEARSLVCNDCGKKFSTHAAAEFHASKTYVLSSA